MSSRRPTCGPGNGGGCSAATTTPKDGCAWWCRGWPSTGGGICEYAPPPRSPCPARCRRRPRLYAGGGVTAVAPCGPSAVCLIDSTENGDRLVVALRDDHVLWQVSVPGATALAPAGWALRVGHLGEADNILLDDQGHEFLR